MKFLVTGGAGFIGSAVCRRLLSEAGHHLAVLDKLTYAGHLSSLGNLSGHPDLSFIHADICDSGAVRAALETHRPDVVMHLAAESHVDRSITGANDFIRTNIHGTFTL